MSPQTFSLQDHLISCGRDGNAFRIQKPVDGSWKIEDGCTLGIFDFHDDRSVHADYWESHPTGDEILCVLQGRLLASVDHDGATEDAEIGEGQALIVPQGRWHRLRVLEPGRLVVFTPRAGTRLRQHDPAGPATSAD